MLRLSVVVSSLALLAACSSPPRDALPDAAPEAAADAPDQPSSIVFTPVSVTGTSPGGSLDVFHYAHAGFVDGFCPASYLVNFTSTAVDPIYASAWMSISIKYPFTAPGTNTATASFGGPTQALTDDVTFEATRLDPPDAVSPQIVGHFVSHDPAWTFDIAIDLTSQFWQTCI